LIVFGRLGNITVSVRQDVEEELSQNTELKIEWKLMEESAKEQKQGEMPVSTVEVKHSFVGISRTRLLAQI